MNTREVAEKLLKLFRQFDGRVDDDELIKLFESPLRIAILEGKHEMLKDLNQEYKLND